MPAKRIKPYQDWEIIHRSLGKIVERLMFSRVHRKGVVLHFAGDKQLLKRECIKILNAIESAGDEDEKGTITKTWR